MAILYEWRCNDAKCNTKFDAMAPMSQVVGQCPTCGGTAKRLISAPTIDPRLGVDPDFGTLGDKWAKKMERKAKDAKKRQLEHGDDA
jgi:putative FmdB family regulatory protein